MKLQNKIAPPDYEWHIIKNTWHCVDKMEEITCGTAITIATITEQEDKQSWVWQFEPLRAARLGIKVLSGKSDNQKVAQQIVESVYSHAVEMMCSKSLRDAYERVTP